MQDTAIPIHSSTRFDAHLRLLLGLDLRCIPCWGQGKYLPGTDLHALCEHPPMPEDILSANYVGGLAILCGTAHPLGGYVLGADVDQGPEIWPALPRGFLYLEAGTRPGSWHFFLRVVNGLDGQLLLRDHEGNLVAELKGRGYALRSWPTRPPDKPAGYCPWAIAWNLAADPPTLTARQVAEGLADYLGRVLDQEVRLEDQGAPRRGAAPERRWSPTSGFAQRFEAALEAAGTRLGSPKANGWQLGRCPFHQDRNPSFSVTFQLGAWKCFAGCGAGGLNSLALRLGILPGYAPKTHRRISPFEVPL